MIQSSSFNTPVLFLTFNRLSTTKKVFEEIRKSKTPRLYISSDGPRENKMSEFKKIQEIRDYLIENIDWECEVFTLFQKENLGCKYAVSKAIDWFFSNEEMGIVLEDDCLPSQGFFKFCQDLLIRYKDDARIFLINGYNHQERWKTDECDYFFSLLGGIWGWASWRRAWQHYDVEIKDIDSFINIDGFRRVLGPSLGKIKQDMIYNGVINKNVNSWALQWGYARHKNSGLTCIPSKSLIENIGFGDNATHTDEINIRQVRRHEIDGLPKENPFVITDIDYDKLMFKKESFFSRIARQTTSILN